MTKSMHALHDAMMIQSRAAVLGFDWPDGEGPRAKVNEELRELDAARSDAEQFEELGDLLFALVNHARHLGLEPESALAAANAKFERRFGHVEKRLRERGLAPEDVDLEQLDAYWNEAKRLEKSTPSE